VYDLNGVRIPGKNSHFSLPSIFTLLIARRRNNAQDTLTRDRLMAKCGDGKIASFNLPSFNWSTGVGYL
jgi:hypothetical protein